LTRQGHIREQLIKIKMTESCAKKPTPSVKTVSFSDYLRESPTSTPTKTTTRLQSRSKSSSPFRKTTSSLSDLDEFESESESDSESEIESDNLAELIRFKELDTLERLKASDEDEFLKHVEAKRQSYLKHDYSENEGSSNATVSKSSRESRKSASVGKKKVKGKNGKRSQSAPSYLRPTEASMNMARSKSPKSDRNKVKKSVSLNPNPKRAKPRNKTLLGLDFALGLSFFIFVIIEF